MEAADDHMVACWACTALVQIPNGADDKPASSYKCGWCGVITGAPEASARTRRAWDPLRFISTDSRSARVAAALLRWSLVGAVQASILSVLFVGTGYILELCHGWARLPALALAYVLAFNILLNCCAAMLRSPGYARDVVKVVEGGVPQGAYDDCTYCSRCAANGEKHCFKPLRAHHCQVCKACVLDMDHHCRYLNNCIGRRNYRHFLMFLLYLIWGTAYALALCCWYVWRQWSDVQAFLHGAEYQNSPVWQYRVFFFMRLAYLAPPWLKLALYFSILCFCALVCVSTLFFAQLSLLVRGQTYIETLRYGRNAPGLRPSGMQALRQVFGAGPPIWWLWPSWEEPPDPAALSGISAKKDP